MPSACKWPCMFVVQPASDHFLTLWYAQAVSGLVCVLYNLLLTILWPCDVLSM